MSSVDDLTSVKLKVIVDCWIIVCLSALRGEVSLLMACLNNLVYSFWIFWGIDIIMVKSLLVDGKCGIDGCPLFSRLNPRSYYITINRLSCWST